MVVMDRLGLLGHHKRAHNAESINPGSSNPQKQHTQRVGNLFP